MLVGGGVCLSTSTKQSSSSSLISSSSLLQLPHGLKGLLTFLELVCFGGSLSLLSLISLSTKFKVGSSLKRFFGGARVWRFGDSTSGEGDRQHDEEFPLSTLKSDF